MTTISNIRVFPGLLLAMLLGLTPDMLRAEDVSLCMAAQTEKRNGNDERAIVLYAQCIARGDLRPRIRSIALNNLGNLELQRKDYNRAINHFDEALRLQPAYAKALNNRGMAYQRKGLYNKAIEDFDAALKADSGLLNAYNNLAWVRATCPVTSLRDGLLAVELALLANKLSTWADADSLDTLAAAYAETGRFEQAVETQMRAIELADKDTRAEKEARLTRYRNHGPYREALQ